MLNIKMRMKIKLLKKKLILLWYTLMKPLAYIENKIYKYKDYKYECKQNKISNWTDEYAIELYSKALIKRIIRIDSYFEEFVVAEWCNNEYGLETIRNNIINQNYNKDLKSWGYKLPFYDVNRIEKLTELLRLELIKYKEIKCEYIIDEKIYSYQAKDYKKTLVVRFNLDKV